MYTMKNLLIRHKNVRKKGFLWLLASLAFIGISFSGNDFEIVRNLDIFASTIRQLNQNYVDPINPGALTKRAIDAMLSTLDPYTNYIAESDIEDYRFMTTGQYGGIGASVKEIEGNIVISEVYENYAAHKAGIQVGDILLEINGKTLKDRSLDEISSLMKGQSGTTISVILHREGEPENLHRELKREDVKIENIPYYGMVSPTTGYIKLEGFTQNAGREVREAFNSLKTQYPAMSALILDLRGNGGGLLNEAVNIVNLFVGQGQEVVTTRSRIKERNQMHRTLNPAFDPLIPLAILVDERSASASEIVAGAIQDMDRGLVIGQTTFGKGLVQNVVPLSYNAQLKVTVAKYYIPSGRCVQAIDYSNRKSSGKVTSMPDSLRTAYRTKGGRIVYDGHGIEPDVFLINPNFSTLTMTLVKKHHIFDFATLYKQRVSEIAPAASFSINDSLYNSFTDFLSTREYSYETHSERALSEFREATEKEGYFNSLSEEYEILKSRIMKNKNEDLKTFRAEIAHFLREEIVTRYYFQRGKIESQLQNDPEVAQAIRLLADKEAFQHLLKPGTIIRQPQSGK
jgi:carboxyl-terminal processing protease